VTIPDRIDRYELIDVLGRGGASSVYRARDTVIGRDVALKTLELAKLGPRGAEYRVRFEREARAAGQLDHPGIVRVYDVGEDDEQAVLFLALEYVDGGSLADHMEAGIELEPWHVAELGARLAEALQAAHDAGIVHRDVKPANVLLGRDGSVKITDFGIARLGVSDLTRSGSTVGTPFYMAPEQITARAVDGRADLYAVGVILYELLAGRRPFTGEGIGDLVYKIANEDAPPLERARPELPEELTAVVHRCLTKEPGERHPSGRALAAVLREACPPPSPIGELPWVGPGAGRGPATVVDSPARTLPSPPVFTREVDGSTTTRVDSASGLESMPGGRLRAILLAGVAAIAVTLGVVLLMPGRASPPAVAGNEATRLRQAVNELRRASNLLAAGDAEGAMAAATAVLAVDPGSPAAQDIVARAVTELEGQRLARPEQQADEPVDIAAELRPRPLRTAVPAEPTRVPTPPTPTPVPPEPPLLVVHFDSPLALGALVAEADEERVGELTWDFTEPVILGLRTGEGGPVTGEIELPVGSFRLRIELHSGRRGQIAAEEFEQGFPAGSRWRLTVEMAGKRATPEFRLEPDGGA
jgi:hypothetical protein